MYAHGTQIILIRTFTIVSFGRTAQKTMCNALKIGTATLLLLSIFHTSALASEPINIGGTGTGLGTMKLLGEAFEKIHPGVKVQIIPDLGGAGGIVALLQGSLDIAISGSALNRDEKVSGIVAAEYARTPLVFVTHKNVRKIGLTAHELEKIYDGTVQKWPDGQTIRPVLRPEIETNTKIITAISPGMGQALKAAKARKEKIIAITDRENAEIVSTTPGSLGSSTLTQIATEKLPIKILSFEGVVPNLTSLSNGSYRLFKPLYLVTTSRISPEAKHFAEFVRSAHGSKILSQSGNLVIEVPAAK